MRSDFSLKKIELYTSNSNTSAVQSAGGRVVPTREKMRERLEISCRDLIDFQQSFRCTP